MSESKLLHPEITKEVINAFYHVYNNLGFGFLEKVYENALSNTLKKRGLQVQQQFPIIVYFDSEIVGEYIADLVVNECIIIELKALEEIHPRHEAQLLNYLRATHMEVGLILNFGEQPTFKRKILTNNRKQNST
jgi:GxxExxY protein